ADPAAPGLPVVTDDHIAAHTALLGNAADRVSPVDVISPAESFGQVSRSAPSVTSHKWVMSQRVDGQDATADMARSRQALSAATATKLLEHHHSIHRSYCLERVSRGGRGSSARLV